MEPCINQPGEVVLPTNFRPYFTKRGQEKDQKHTQVLQPTCEVPIHTDTQRGVVIIAAPAAAEGGEAGVALRVHAAVVAAVAHGDGVHPARALAVDVARHVVREREAGLGVLAPHALACFSDALRTVQAAGSRCAASSSSQFSSPLPFWSPCPIQLLPPPHPHPLAPLGVPSLQLGSVVSVSVRPKVSSCLTPGFSFWPLH